jgi:hypothetical protein
MGSSTSTTEGMPAPFELRVSVPCDERFVSTVEALVVFAAKASGSPLASAEHLAAAVAQAVRDCRCGHTSDAPVPVVLRRRAGTLEVLVGDRIVTQP